MHIIEAGIWLYLVVLYKNNVKLRLICFKEDAKFQLFEPSQL